MENKLAYMKNWQCVMHFNESSPNDPKNEIGLCSMLNGNKSYVFFLRFTDIQSIEKTNHRN